MSRYKALSTSLTQVVRDLALSGGPPELIDRLSTLQAEYAQKADLPSTHQFQALKMEEDVAPSDGSRQSEADLLAARQSNQQRLVRGSAAIDPSQERAIEEAHVALQRAMRLAGKPGGIGSLTPEQKSAAIRAAEQRIDAPQQYSE